MVDHSAVSYVKALKRRGYSYRQIATWAGMAAFTVFKWVSTTTKPNKHLAELVKIRLGKVYRKIISEEKPRGMKFVDI